MFLRLSASRCRHFIKYVETVTQPSMFYRIHSHSLSSLSTICAMVVCRHRTDGKDLFNKSVIIIVVMILDRDAKHETEMIARHQSDESV